MVQSLYFLDISPERVQGYAGFALDVDPMKIPWLTSLLCLTCGSYQ